MASPAARAAHTSRFWSTSVAKIWSNLEGSLSSSVLQHRTYTGERLDGHILSSPSAADPLPGELSPVLVQTIGDRPIYHRNAHEKREGFRVYGTPRVERTKKLPGTVVKAEGNVALKRSWHDSPKQTITNPIGEKLAIGSACGHDNISSPSASITSKAIAILKHRQQQGACTDSYFFVEILKRCSQQKDLKATRQVHDYIIQSGTQKHPYVATTLLNVYIKCGRLEDAQRVFDGLDKTHRNVITWNVMIGAYAKSGHGKEAYQLFLQMNRDGFTPNAMTYMSILNPSANAGALDWLKEVHSHAHRAGLDSDLRLGNALMHMYAKSGSIDDARLLFDRMEERNVITWTIMVRALAENDNIPEARLLFDRMEKRNVITWTIMISAYAESGCGLEAYQLFLQMNREGFIPDAVTYATILNSSASAGDQEWVKEVHDHARRAGLDSDSRVGNAVVHMYCKSGRIDDARLLFDRMEKRDLITWNLLIGGYAKSGNGVKAYGLFLQMKREGFTPDAFTYASILNPSAASAGALKWVTEVHGHAIKAGLESNLRVGNALIHMYAKIGSIDDARLVFDRMEKRDVVTWTAMISALALHGCGDEALKLFKKMISDHVNPNGISFVAVLSACCHAGLVDDGRKLFLAMKEEYGVEATVVHYTCMVDLLGRAGHLEEAKLLIDSMPVEPNAVTWTTLLGACRTYGNVELGEVAAEEVLKLEPKDASAYVLLANIYAAAGEWEKKALVRTRMQEKGVRKEPGRSWIEVDNKVHEFVAGDSSHPEKKALYSELTKLALQLKAKGYIPDTKLVLHDVDEEEKEVALCSHSERLAIAYGLLRLPGEQPIRVGKNLRVCSDCHAATKLISEVTGREIIVRDANRFHHFKDGKCSCGDYW